MTRHLNVAWLAAAYGVASAQLLKMAYRRSHGGYAAAAAWRRNGSGGLHVAGGGGVACGIGSASWLYRQCNVCRRDWARNKRGVTYNRISAGIGLTIYSHQRIAKIMAMPLRPAA